MKDKDASAYWSLPDLLGEPRFVDFVVEINLPEEILDDGDPFDPRSTRTSGTLA